MERVVIGYLIIALVVGGLFGFGGTQLAGPDVSKLKGEVSSLQSDNERLKGEVSSLQSQIADLEEKLPPEKGLDVAVKQKKGKLVFWVLPGKRRLSPKVFGSPNNTRYGSELLKSRIKEAEQLSPPFDESIPRLLKDLPILVAAPEKARETAEAEEGISQKLAVPSLFSDKGKVTDGKIEVTYKDRQPYDLPGKPSDTLDDVKLTAQFTDPAGNEYEIVFDHVVQPPIPGYETGGGVITNSWHHGTSGTGSPLMPMLYNYGAFWGIGHVKVNGEIKDINKGRVVHVMTTQIVRDKNYRLAVDEELPLRKDNTIAGQSHHTHLVVLPIQVVKGVGPVFKPLKTSFTLPNGKKQPFIHVMFEQDTIVESPFSQYSKTGGFK